MADKSAKTGPTASAGLNKILASNIAQWMKDDCRFVLMFRDTSMTTFYALLFIDVEDNPLWGAELIYQFRLPKNFPHEPPSVECLTPNGHMEPGGPICLGIGEWHKDQWRGSLGIVGFVNYVWCCMTNMDQVEHGIRIIKNTQPKRLREYAQESREYNRVDPSTHGIYADFEARIRDYPNIPAIRALQALRKRTTAPAHPARTLEGREPQKSPDNTTHALIKEAAPVPPKAAPAAQLAAPRDPPKAAPTVRPAPQKSPDNTTHALIKVAPEPEAAGEAFDDYMSALGL